ncbi:hypothetical protein NDO75_19790 [Natrinema sp. 1APR25-10V2]|nr:hypothetical protein [Natrinema sp. 1APR25-10V2]
MVVFVVPILLGAYFRDMNQGILIGIETGLVFAVVSQFFESKAESGLSA